MNTLHESSPYGRAFYNVKKRIFVQLPCIYIGKYSKIRSNYKNHNYSIKMLNFIIESESCYGWAGKK